MCPWLGESSTPRETFVNGTAGMQMSFFSLKSISSHHAVSLGQPEVPVSPPKRPGAPWWNVCATEPGQPRRCTLYARQTHAGVTKPPNRLKSRSKLDRADGGTAVAPSALACRAVLSELTLRALWRACELLDAA